MENVTVFFFLSFTIDCCAHDHHGLHISSVKPFDFVLMACSACSILKETFLGLLSCLWCASSFQSYYQLGVIAGLVFVFDRVCTHPLCYCGPCVSA